MMGLDAMFSLLLHPNGSAEGADMADWLWTESR